MTDPGVALQAATLAATFELLGVGETVERMPPAAPDPHEAVEALALAAGVRARRVLLEPGWWRGGAVPMLGRIVDRRSVPREEDAAGEGDTGWVALVPRPQGGYVMRAAGPDGRTLLWPVDEGTAARLAPFAFAFHARFPARALGARDVLRFAWRHGSKDLGLLLLAGLVAALLGLLGPVAMGWLIDHAIPSAATTSVLAVVAALGVAGLAAIAVEALRSLAVLRFEARTGVAMQAALVDRIASAPAAFFRRYSSADLALRMGALNAVQRAITGSTIATFVTSLFMLANVALMLAYSPTLTLAAAGILLLVVALSTTLGLLRLRVGPRIEATDARASAIAFEHFGGMAKLRAAAAEPRAFARWAAAYEDYRTANRASTKLSNLESIALSVLQPAATLLVLALAWHLSRDARLSTGAFVAFHAAMLSLIAGVHALVNTALDVVNLRPLWDRALPILQAVPEDGEGRGERLEPTGDISLEGVHFAYPGGPPVLQGIDLAIRAGEFVAIVGASGSGKSTLVRLLLGFEQASAGRVCYDGRDIRALDLRHLRSRLGCVLQDGRLWAGDILANIAGASAIGVDEAREAARRAGLEADIEAMPMGLYTLVGEGMSTLSGGQRQRVLLARALAGRPKVLLLDEATSALDAIAQARVLEELGTLAATRIVIAHRLDTVRHADRIVVLEAGRVVQEGRYEALAAAEGAFAAMLARARAGTDPRAAPETA